LNAIKTLLVKRLRNELTPQEAEELQQWIAKNANNRALYNRLGDDEAVASLLAKMDEFDEKKGWDYVREHADKVDVDEQKVTVHRVHFLKTAWFRYAAAILLLITGIATYFFIHTFHSYLSIPSGGGADYAISLTETRCFARQRPCNINAEQRPASATEQCYL
jgi:transmembrane sensor